MPKILVVDDDPNVRFVIKRMLEYEGYEVVEAWNAEESFQVLNEEPIDLVVMDVVLPVISGWDAAKTIKTKENAPRIPILVLTAQTDDLDIEENMTASKADAMLEKPIDKKDMLAKVESLLNNHAK